MKSALSISWHSLKKHRSLAVPTALATLPLLCLLPGCGGGGSNSPFTPTPGPTSIATPVTTGTPAATGTSTTATPVMTRTPSPTGTVAATSTPSGTPGATARPTATTQPTTAATPRPTPTVRPTVQATATPRPTATPVVPGAPLFFDGFLADNGGQPANDFNLFFLWNVTGGTVDLRGGNVPGANDPEQRLGRFVDLDGGQSGRFATRAALPFAAGQTYNLRFTYMSTDGKSNAATVTIGTKTFRVSTTSRSPQTFNQNFSFPATTTATLAFQDAGNDDNGIGIDTVMVSASP